MLAIREVERHAITPRATHSRRWHTLRHANQPRCNDIGLDGYKTDPFIPVDPATCNAADCQEQTVFELVRGR